MDNKYLINQTQKIPDDDLRNIVIDQKGYKWIGTLKHGLIEFDGTGFKIYDNILPSTSIISINPLCVDKKNNIWVSFSGPFSGVARFDGTTWTVISEIRKPITFIKQEDNGKMYFGTSEGVITYTGSQWSKLQLPSESIYRYNVLALDISKTGEIAIGYDEGLLLYDGKKWKSLNERNSELKLGTVRSVKYSNDGKLYIGYGGGLGKGGFSTLEGDKWKHYDKYNSTLPDQMVRDIKASKDGTIWLATNDGVLKVTGNKFTPLKFRPGKFHNTIMGLALENDKTVWISTTTGLVKLTE